jgi:hypothetical protein
MRRSAFSVGALAVGAAAASAAASKKIAIESARQSSKVAKEVMMKARGKKDRTMGKAEMGRRQAERYAKLNVRAVNWADLSTIVLEVCATQILSVLYIDIIDPNREQRCDTNRETCFGPAAAAAIVLFCCYTARGMDGRWRRQRAGVQNSAGYGTTLVVLCLLYGLLLMTGCRHYCNRSIFSPSLQLVLHQSDEISGRRFPDVPFCAYHIINGYL